MAYLKFECDGVPLSLVRQQIQTLELHASLRIVAGGRLLDSEHMTAFMNALAERDQLMSQVVSLMTKLHSNGHPEFDS
jgi:hypothetical protein